MAESTNLEERVRKALDEAREYLISHGGDLEFVELAPDNSVKVRLMGACGGCPHAAMTLKRGVEAFLKQEIPEITAVIQVA